MPRIAIFADIQNIYYTARQAYARALDYRWFCQPIRQEGESLHAADYALTRHDAAK